MKPFRWNEIKNKWLIRERKISFEEIILSITEGQLLGVDENPSQEQYKGQKILIVEARGYAYLVPMRETESEVFLITIIPSRKATRKYLRRRKGENGETATG